MKIVHYASDYKKEWDSFVDAAKNPLFMHKRDFMEYHSDRFEDCSLMFFDEKDKLIALLPANIKDNILYSHQGLTYGGFIIGSDMKQTKMLECFDELKNFMQEKGIEKLVYKTIPHIFHKYPAEEDLYALFVNNAKLIKIEPSTTIFLKNAYKMPKGRKAQISRAKREGVAIEESTDFKTFIDLENNVLTKKHNTKAVHTAEELELLHSRFPDNIKLYIANLDGRIIAGTLIFEYENIVHTQYLAADDTAREIGGLDLLIKTLIDKYKETKTYFDFGISTEDAGKYLNEGLIRQKEGFGGRTTVYQTWEYNIK
ncbi:MAG: GNAT family N-acetyltransferase [Candidatus Gastranaerophilaceae bacterium]